MHNRAFMSSFTRRWMHLGWWTMKRPLLTAVQTRSSGCTTPELSGTEDLEESSLVWWKSYMYGFTEAWLMHSRTFWKLPFVEGLLWLRDASRMIWGWGGTMPELSGTDNLKESSLVWWESMLMIEHMYSAFSRYRPCYDNEGCCVCSHQHHPTL